MILYFIISFILNVYILKVTEESRPCYILIPEFSAQIITNFGFKGKIGDIVQDILNIKNQNLRNSKNRRNNSLDLKSLSDER